MIDIYKFGAQAFGNDQADAYFASLETAFEFLASYPEAARLRTEIIPPVRCHPHGSHIIVYTDLASETVTILRVRHAHENWDETPT